MRTLVRVVLATVIATYAAASQQNPSRDTADPNRMLLDSLGAPSSATLIREYRLTNDGATVRDYATTLPLDEAPTAITLFYRNKLLANGWQALEEHAAISGYAKRNQTVTILRYGPTDPGLPPGAQLLKSAAPPADARFFFGIEVGPRQ